MQKKNLRNCNSPMSFLFEKKKVSESFIAVSLSDRNQKIYKSVELRRHNSENLFLGLIEGVRLIVNPFTLFTLYCTQQAAGKTLRNFGWGSALAEALRLIKHQSQPFK